MASLSGTVWLTGTRQAFVYHPALETGYRQGFSYGTELGPLALQAFSYNLFWPGAVIIEDGDGILPSGSITCDTTPTISFTASLGNGPFSYAWTVSSGGITGPFVASGVVLNVAQVTLPNLAVGDYRIAFTSVDVTGSGTTLTTLAFSIVPCSNPFTISGFNPALTLDEQLDVFQIEPLVPQDDDYVRYLPQWMSVHGTATALPSGALLFRTLQVPIHQVRLVNKSVRTILDEFTILEVPADLPRQAWHMQTRFTPRDTITVSVQASGTASNVRRSASLYDFYTADEPLFVIGSTGHALFRNLAQRIVAVEPVSGSTGATGAVFQMLRSQYILPAEAGIVPDTDVFFQVSGAIWYRIHAGSPCIDPHHATIQLPGSFGWMPTSSPSKAAGFNGSNYLETPTTAHLSPNQPMSFGCWVNLTDNSHYQVIASKGNWSSLNGNLEWVLHVDPTLGIRCAIMLAGQSQSAWTGTIPSTGVWHHVGFTLAAGTMTVYLDGVPGGNNTSCSGPFASGNYYAIRLGQSLDGLVPLSGSIDEAGLWSGAVNWTSLYNNGVAKNYADLTSSDKMNIVAYWDLDEPAGSSRSDATGSGVTFTDHGSVAQVDGNSAPVTGEIRTTTFRYQSKTLEPTLTVSLSGNPYLVPSQIDLPNRFDELGVLAGLVRRQDEDNIAFRQRVYSRFITGLGVTTQAAAQHISQDLNQVVVLGWDGQSTLNLAASGIHGVRQVDVRGLPPYEGHVEEMISGNGQAFTASKAQWRSGWFVTVDGAPVSTLRYPNLALNQNALTFGAAVSGRVVAAFQADNYTLQYSGQGFVTSITPVSGNVPSSSYQVVLSQNCRIFSPADPAYQQVYLLNPDGTPNAYFLNLRQLLAKGSPNLFGEARWGSEAYWFSQNEDQPPISHMPVITDLGVP